MSEAKSVASEPTEIAGRYQIVQKLGAGAFGTVYKAKDKILGRMVAIKTIRLEGLAAAGASIEELVERFSREARVSAQLKHPNIVTIYDVGDSQGMSYLAMEFIDGVGLDRVIATAGRLAIERAASMGVQIADALDFAHKNGVVHRDIKPANIMIEAGDRVKVTDFGIAKELSGEHLTMTGSLLGTPSYMSPEQARGAQLDGRSDLFAVGAILYEMLAGQKAFRGDSITGLIFKIITEEPQPIKAIDQDLPDEMVRIISKALAKAPDMRYQAGRELADDLAAFTRPGATPTLRQVEIPTVAGLAGSSAPGSAAPPTVQGFPTVATGAPATQVAAARTQVSPPPRPTPPAPPAVAAAPRSAAAPRKSGSGAGLLIALGLVGLLFVGGVAVGGWYFFLRKPAVVPSADAGPDTASTAARGAELPGGGPPATAAAATQPEGGGSAPAQDTGAAAVSPHQEPAAPRETGRGAATAPRETTTRPSLGGAASQPQPHTAQPEPAAEPPAAASGSFLDDEAAEAGDGAEAGQRLGQPYRGGRSGPSFPSTGRFQRDKSPRNLAPAERPAVAVLRHVMNAEELFKRQHGHYGRLNEMASAKVLFLDVPVTTPLTFQRRGYNFVLTLDEDDGFKVLAQPTRIGPRIFTGDDTGFIREGTD